MSETWEYTSKACMECGKECDRWEEVDIGGNTFELWCYCQECDTETFHPRVYKQEQSQ